MGTTTLIFAVPWLVLVVVGGIAIVRRFDNRRPRAVDVGAVSSAWLTEHSVDVRDHNR
jgi:hypothetical protein